MATAARWPWSTCTPVIVGNQDGGRVRAEASLVRRGRHVTVVRIAVTGAEGRLLAEMTTTNVPV